MSTKERLLEAGYEDVVFFSDFSYDDALIGIDTNDRAVYDFSKMVQWLIEHEDFDNESEAFEWIEYNTIKSLPYIDSRTNGKAPIVVRPLDW